MAEGSSARVEVKNVPPGINDFKLTTQLKQSVGNDSIKIDKKKDNDGNKVFEIVFPNFRDAKSFVHRGINVRFGGKEWKLEVNLVEGHAPKASPTNTEDAFLNAMEPDIVVDDANAPYTWSSLVEQYGRMPIAPGTKCVIVRENNSDDFTPQSLNLYFQNKKRSGGDKIKNMIKMVDGMLIQYEDNAVAEVVAKKQHSLANKDILTYLRTVPSLSDKILMLDNIPKDEGTEETLRLLLENCDDPEYRSPSLITRGENPAQCMAIYEEPMDMERLASKVRQKLLEGQQLKAHLLPGTNCIKICGEIKSLSNDAIRLNMENFRRSKGGEVTLVQRCGDNIALVCFAECYVAERVVQSWSDQQMVISKVPVTVSLYYHCFSKLHLYVGSNKASLVSEQSEGEIDEQHREGGKQVFRYTPKCPEVVEYLKHNQEQFDKFEKVLEGMADVKCEFKDQKLCGIIVTPKEDQKSQSEVEKKYNVALDSFFAQFTMLEAHFDETKLADLRKRNNWKAKDKYVTLKSSGENIKVLLRWIPPIVQIIGSVENVENARQILVNLTHAESQVMSLKERIFRAVVETGCLEEMKQIYPHLSITPEYDSHQLKLFGTQEDISAGKMQIYQFAQNIEEDVLKKLGKHQRQYLLMQLQHESTNTNSINIRALVQAKFQEKKIKASISLKNNDEVVLSYFHENEHKNAISTLETLISSRSVKLTDREMDAINTKEWKRMEENICATGSRSIFMDDKHVIIAGVASTLDEARTELMNCIDENCVREVEIKSTKLRLRVFMEFDDIVKQQLQGIKYNVTTLDDGSMNGVHIEGNKAQVEKADPLVRDRLKGYVQMSPLVLRDPGIPEYFKTTKAKKFVEQTERDTKCCIVLNASEDEVSKKVAATPVVIPTSAKPKACVQLPKSNVNIRVFKADITEHKCGAFINASNDMLELREGGVSGNILHKGGASIKGELDKLRQQNIGMFLPGDVRSTTSGSLRNCKRIIHVVGPDWKKSSHSNNCNYLKACVHGALVEADKHKLASVAIPAVSCGIYGGVPSVCIRLIVETIQQYFTGNKSKVTMVDLIENSKDDVINCFMEEVKKYPASNTDQQEEQSYTQAAPHSSKSSKKKKAQSAHSDNTRIGSLNVELCNGDITQDSSDVIVNSTNSNFDLRNGKVSPQILKKGGNVISQQCTQNNHPLNKPNMRITDGGKLKCKQIIHVVVPVNQMQIEQVVSLILETVDALHKSVVALPAIGTGNLNISPSKVAQYIRTGIVYYTANHNPSHLKTVKVVVFQQNMMQDFHTELFRPWSPTQGTNASTSEEPGILQKGVNYMKSMLYGGSSKESSVDLEEFGNSVSITFCATEKSNVNEAQQAITAHVQEVTDVCFIDDDVIGKLGEEERKEIKDLEKNLNVKITNSSTKHLKRLVIKGLHEKTLQAKIECMGIIREFQEAENVSQYVTWEYVGQNKGMVGFSKKANLQLENTFKTDSSSKCTVSLGKGKQMTVTFKDMTGKFINSGHTTEIMRRNKSEESLPSHWSPMGDKHLDKVLVPVNTSEYQRVMTQYGAGGKFHNTVISLERIQHTSQYKQFVAKKQEVTNKMTASGIINQQPAVRELYHGTSADVASKIFTQGFDRGFAGSANAHAYGKGVYFALNGQYSHGYARPDANQHRRMFLADVVTGEYCVGTSNLITPPVKPNSSSKADLYDSVVNSLNTPSIYVVFKDASAYPKYLLTYT
nr:poly [ADP-ribose] polymerase 14 [Ciona intestinalis]|eukprot:XP_018668925.1 poly [ADP-ribose] polymerase 14 [Ciona intestinalis]